MDSPIVQNDPKLKKILEQLIKFGFEFYSLDEDKTPLVKGPNNQIVPINYAIEFVNKQIEMYRSQQPRGSLEDMPSMPAPESSAAERSIETSIEIQNDSLEKNQERQQQTIQVPQNVQVPQKAPQIQLSKPKIKPYGDGFEPKSFDSTDINQTIKFIHKNAQKPNSSSQKWLAEQFKKFLKEAGVKQL